MTMIIYKHYSLCKAISKYLLIVLLTLLCFDCFAQNKTISEVHLAYASHVISQEKIGKYLYFQNPDTSWQNEIIDTFSYLIVRGNKVILKGTIAGNIIETNLQKAVQEGDIVTYYNFKCKRKDFVFSDKNMSFTFTVPFYKYGRKD